MFPGVPLIPLLPDTLTYQSLAQVTVCFSWMGKSGSSTGGCWPQPSTMTSSNPMSKSWPILSIQCWWVALSPSHFITPIHSTLTMSLLLGPDFWPHHVHQTFDKWNGIKGTNSTHEACSFTPQVLFLSHFLFLYWYLYSFFKSSSLSENQRGHFYKLKDICF